MGKISEGIKSYTLPITKYVSHRDVMCSIGYIVNILKTLVTEGKKTYCDHFVMNVSIESLCCTLETSIIQYVNYTSTKRNKRKYA